MEKNETTLEDVKESIENLEKTIKQATNMILECLSMISCGQTFKYQNTHAHVNKE